MAKRTFWFVTGVGAGLWARRKVVQTIEQRMPKAVADNLRSSLDRLKSEVSVAGDTARDAMKQKEEELRNEVSQIEPNKTD